MNHEACSFCNRRCGLLSTETPRLQTVGEELACDHCLSTLAALALRLALPDTRKLAQVITREITKSAANIGEAEEIRARMVAAAFLPDVTTAVENVVYIIEHEAQKISTDRDAETNGAARQTLKALLHTTHLPTARKFVAGEREKASEGAARAAQ